MVGCAFLFYTYIIPQCYVYVKFIGECAGDVRVGASGKGVAHVVGDVMQCDGECYNNDVIC